VIPEHSDVEFVLRPPNISGDQALEQEYLVHVVTEKNLKKDGIVSRMQCTSPFQSVASIVSAVRALGENSERYDSVQLITLTSPSIYKALRIDPVSGCLRAAVEGGSVGPSNRQGLPKTYFRSNFYVTRVENIISGDVMGKCSYGIICDPKEKIDIDCEFDLKIAQIIAKANPEWLSE